MYSGVVLRKKNKPKEKLFFFYILSNEAFSFFFLSFIISK